MKINKSEPNCVFFEDVKSGDVFLYEGDYYIKFEDSLYDDNHNCYNCAYISDGIASYVAKGECVELVNGEFKFY